MSKKTIGFIMWGSLGVGVTWPMIYGIGFIVFEGIKNNPKECLAAFGLLVYMGVATWFTMDKAK